MRPVVAPDGTSEIDEASHAEHTEAVRLATVAVTWAERELGAR